jgi:NADH-quinone oxidoreductase subunit M
MASVGLPGTAGFVGEFLVLNGAFQVNSWVAFFAAFGLILGPAYALYLYRRVVFGKLVHEDLKTILDLNAREVFLFVPLVLVVLWMGIYPSSFLGPMHASVAKLINDYQLTKTAAVQAPSAAAQ